VAVAYGFLLPGIAVLHVRHAAVRQSGAILGTTAGAAVAVVGLVSFANVDVRPVLLFVLGMWWWTIGKMWAQTGALPTVLGRFTAALGLLAFAVALLEAFSTALTLPDPAPAHLVIGVWLIALATVFARERRAAEPVG
jgi:hypothetical protein